jgi:adenylate cyclase
LFCDLVGFTEFSNNNTPDDVISCLQDIVTAFEECSGRHGMEKIKTIGDAYMCTADLLRKVEDPVTKSVKAGLEMVKLVPEMSSGRLQARVGIHYGEAIGGIIGSEKFFFDIWGPTVNLASRLESHSLPGKVNVSADVWHALSGSVRGSDRGEIEVKGVGPLQMYFVDRV